MKVFQLCLFALVPVAAGHILLLEDELDECSETSCFGADFPPDHPGDSSFENPQDQPLVPGQGELCQHNLYGIVNSQALYGYLNSPDDFDVYNYNVTWEDFLQAQALGPPFNIPGQPVVFISASAFPQACNNTLPNYLSLALIADPFTLCTLEGTPLSATDYNDIPSELAAKLDPGKTVVFVSDEIPDTGNNEDREIYELVHDGEPVTLSWFLPKGCMLQEEDDGHERLVCTADSKTIGLYACNREWANLPTVDVELLSNQTSSTTDVEPLSIQFVVFDERQTTSGDYTLNIGIAETCYTPQPDLATRSENYQHMVDGCEPIPEESGQTSNAAAFLAWPFWDEFLALLLVLV